MPRRGPLEALRAAVAAELSLAGRRCGAARSDLYYLNVMGGCGWRIQNRPDHEWLIG